MKIVIAVRGDIKMGKGKLAVQVAHAAVECVIRSQRREVDAWRAEGGKKIAVKATNLEELLDLQSRAKGLGIVSYLVCDRGLTQFSEPTITCLGIGPAKDELLDTLTGGMKLV